MKNRERRYEPNHQIYEAIQQQYGFTEEQAANFRSQSNTMSADNPLSDYYGNLWVQADIYSGMLAPPLAEVDTETTHSIGKLSLVQSSVAVLA